MHNSKIVDTLIGHEALKARIPLWEKATQTVVSATNRANSIIQEPSSSKQLLIVWPCSADFEDSLLQYWEFIAKMREKYKQSGLEIIMRYYTGKPRTIWWWKWLANSNPGEEADTNKGIEESRRIAVKLLGMGVPLADEMLHPELIRHFDDIYSYLAVGARSTENQYHREVASGLDMPVWMKNPTSGDLSVMLNSIQAWQSPSHYTIGDSVIDSIGNSGVHGILRWGTNPNYDIESLKQLEGLIEKRGDKIKNPGIIIDASHDNSKWTDGKKDPMKQGEVVTQVIKDKATNLVRGYMIESYLQTGRQEYSDSAIHGLSLTDGCIWIEETERIIQTVVDSIS